jgi:hypothetical protein
VILLVKTDYLILDLSCGQVVVSFLHADVTDCVSVENRDDFNAIERGEIDESLIRKTEINEPLASNLY